MTPPGGRPLNVTVLASGQGTNLVALAQAIEAGIVPARIGLVICDQDEAPVLAAARSRGIATLVLPGQGRRAEYDAQLQRALEQEQSGLVVLAGFMRILGPALCQAFAGRIINLHPALLPAFRGANAIRDALAAGVWFTGCTTHFVTAELDAGPIILQAACRVLPGDTERSLRARVQKLEHVLLPETVRLFAEGRVGLKGNRATIQWGPGAGTRGASDAWLPEGL